MTPDRLGALLASFRGLGVAVVGDLMLDEYVWGDVGRISPDAPVQVVDIRSRSRAIGGAGNVAHNLVAAGASVELYGLAGDDAAGRTLVELLSAAGVGVSGVSREPGRVTTVKTRVIARGQHVVRLDEEHRKPIGAQARAALLASLRARARETQVVLVSDYAKGVIDATLVADLASALRSEGSRAPIVVDPKLADLSAYAGCTAITPNQREAEQAARMTIAGEPDLEEAGRRIRAACGAPWVLITRGEKGMALSAPDGSVTAIPARAREVYDVTGAGDTVLAFFGLGLAAGIPAAEAAQIANIAAGVKIGKIGTAAVGPAEILAWSGSEGGAGKAAGLSEAAARVEHERSRGRRIVFTNGCFDLLHAGHIDLLEKARALGDFLVVAVNSDASVRRLKGDGRPLVGQEDRVRVLGALDAVDLVLIFDEDTPLDAIHRIHPDILVKGGDYSTETIVGHEFVLGYGGRVETIPLVSGRSTSALIDAIRRAGER